MHQINELIANKTITFYVLLGIALILSRIPVIGKYFRVVNTVIHEAGHAIMTLLFSGEVMEVNLFADTSGNVVSKSKSKFSRVFVAMAGYPFSAAIALLMLYLLKGNSYTLVLIIITSITLALLALAIRNSYGLFWSITFTVINFVLLLYDVKVVVYLLATFYSLIIFTDSIISTFYLLILTIRNPKKAGDASILEKISSIPSIIWSLIFVVLSGLMAYYSIRQYFPVVNISGFSINV